ncbi:hypothetical protein KR51_00003860 [Rubidibacter lacunae KORDI 51-2]|uniref:Uncharacterized protein n=1 Tax=Rubidibacter lacunae KORDI 51-2 TaxID=582515 RepID=U5DT49_9CHRO|nr:hypothetical protein KR51_00003860 [Rubidibacter lacunae KORDI 51-2]
MCPISRNPTFQMASKVAIREIGIAASPILQILGIVGTACLRNQCSRFSNVRHRSNLLNNRAHLGTLRFAEIAHAKRANVILDTQHLTAIAKLRIRLNRSSS